MAPASPVVEPRATSLLTDAFRQGAITADDIAQRVGERAKVKEKLELVTAKNQLAAEQSPEVQEARQLAVKAANARAKSDLSRAEIDAELQPLKAKAERAGTVLSLLQAESFGTFDTMRNAYTAMGLPIPMKDGAPDLYAMRAEIPNITAYANYLKNAASVASGLEDRKGTAKDSAGNETQAVWKYSPSLGRSISDPERQQIEAAKSIDYNTWKTRGAPKTIFSAAPGSAEVSAIAKPVAAPVVVPEVANAARAALVNAGAATPQTAVQLNDQQVMRAFTPAVQPVQAATPITSTVVQPAGPDVSAFPAGARVESFKAAGSDAFKAPTEAQQRALLALGRFDQSNTMFERLKATNFDPSSWTQYVEAILPNVMKSGGRQEYETAKELWSQGLLRLESGAAISRQEAMWYDKAFFPQPGDSDAVQSAKEAARHDVEKMVARIGASGAIEPDVKKAAQQAYAEADLRATGKFNVTPASAGQSKVYNVGGKKLQRINGRIIVVP